MWLPWSWNNFTHLKSNSFSFASLNIWRGKVNGECKHCSHGLFCLTCLGRGSLCDLSWNKELMPTWVGFCLFCFADDVF